MEYRWSVVEELRYSIPRDLPEDSYWPLLAVHNREMLVVGTSWIPKGSELLEIRFRPPSHQDPAAK